MSSLRLFASLVRSAYEAFSNDKAPRLGAAVAFYTIFSLAPLLLVAMGVASLFLGPVAAQGALREQISSLVGPGAAGVVTEFLGGAYRSGRSEWMTIVGTVTVLVSAGNLFAQLQDALNTLWGVQAKPGLGWGFLLRQRAIAFLLVLVLGVLLLSSLCLSLLVAAATRWTKGEMSMPEGTLQGLNFLTDFIAVFLLLAVIFKVLPYVKIGWTDVWAGAALTALIFSLGKLALAWYLERPTMAAVYGPAGDLVVLLLWVYYATQMIFFGAEFTRVYADRCGARMEPAHFAEFVTTRVVAPEPPAPSEVRPVAPVAPKFRPWTDGAWWAGLGVMLGVLWARRRHP